MSSISIEANNENQLTVEEYVRYIGIKEQIQKFLEDAKVKQVMCDCEKYISGLTIDLTVKYTINKRKP